MVQGAPGGTLYVVATPIGNLGDVTRRAVETLEACPVVAAEDTRHTLKLLAHLGVAKKTLLALHEHSSDADVRRVLERLAAGEDVALVSDAGTPLVSDPGAELVEAAAAAGVRVVPIPGRAPSRGAGGSGLGGVRSASRAFSRGTAPRAAALLRVANEPAQVVLFEAPGRVAATLAELARSTPTRRAAVARELTKVHEEVVRGTLAELADAAANRPWLGEVVLVLGAYDAAGGRTPWTTTRSTARSTKASPPRPRAQPGGPARGVERSIARVYQRVVARRGRWSAFSHRAPRPARRRRSRRATPPRRSPGCPPRLPARASFSPHLLRGRRVFLDVVLDEGTPRRRRCAAAWWHGWHQEVRR